MRALQRIVTVSLLTAGPGLLFPAAGNAADAPPALPPGVSPQLYAITVPTPPTEAQIQLGETLFNDKRISTDGTVACATCHDPAKGFTDHRAENATSAGVGGQHGQRNSPTVLNAMFHASEFWDGRAATLEDQAKLPILNPVEMGQKSGADVVAKLKTIPEYVQRFKTVFGRDITYDDLGVAIAAFERTQYSGNSPFDRYLAGNATAIDDSAKRGWALFNGKARCNDCHAFNATAPLFSDQKFHNIGVAARKQSFPELAHAALGIVKTGDEKQIDEMAIGSKFSELGRFLVTKNQSDIGAFKTETLRNIGITGPYMHDGSMATLWDVIDHYNKGGIPNPYLDGGIQRLGLTEAEIDDLVAFLFTLTDDRYADFNKAEQARQAAGKATRPQRDLDIVQGGKMGYGDPGSTAPDKRNPATIGAF
jgi:cytochrome c peroxidase